MRIVLLLILAILPVCSYGIEPYTCRNGFFPLYQGDIRYAVISAGRNEKINFRSDDSQGCPEKSSCIQKTYLVNGDKVLIAQTEKNWSCVWYFGKKREFVGWLPAKNIRSWPVKKLSGLQDWIGIWKPVAGENSIQIKTSKDKGKLHVAGNATWSGGVNSSGYENVHVGEFEGDAAPVLSRLTIGDGKQQYDCVVKMQLVSGNLIVRDNNFCGGANVSFSDVYRRQP